MLLPTTGLIVLGCNTSQQNENLTNQDETEVKSLSEGSEGRWRSSKRETSLP